MEPIICIDPEVMLPPGESELDFPDWPLEARFRHRSVYDWIEAKELTLRLLRILPTESVSDFFQVYDMPLIYSV